MNRRDGTLLLQHRTGSGFHIGRPFRSMRRMVKMDIIGSLPINIAEMIFMYLEPEDLTNCSAVSKIWYNLSNSDRCWHRICRDFGLEPPKSIKSGFYKSLGNPSRWKQVFRRHSQVIQNWGTNKCKRFNMPNVAYFQVICSASFNSTLVIGYSHNILEVYKIERSKIALVQTLNEMSNQTNVLIHTVIANSQIIAVKYETAVLMYTNSGLNTPKYNFSYVLYPDCIVPRLVSEMNIENIPCLRLNRLDCSRRKIDLGIIGATCFVFMETLSRIFLWDIVKMENKGIIQLHPSVSNLIFFRNKLYLGNCHRLLAYNEQNKEELTIDTKFIIHHILCNKNIILGFCWGKLGGEKCVLGTGSMGSPYFVEEDQLPKTLYSIRLKTLYFTFYHLAEENSYYNKYEMKSYNIQTRKVVWKTEVPLLHNIRHCFHIVAGRYIVFYTPSNGDRTETCTVYDINYGSYLYTIDFDYNILLCTDKYIILKNDYMAKLYHYG